MFKKRINKKRISIVFLSLFVVLAIFFAVAAIYLGDYYKADEKAIGAFMPQGSTWKQEPDGTIVFASDGATKGLIFYPGGKVEHTAYIPLLQAFSELGILCVLIDMPFNIAVFDVNAAEGIQDEYPVIEDWYIGGHSLGGSMAAAYLADNSNDYEGLLLLGSYSTKDLSDTDLAVLSIYGSEDGVLNRNKYEKNKDNLPTNFTEIVIDGGCHAYFGMYGKQDGDGTPSISNEEQITKTAESLAHFLFGK